MPALNSMYRAPDSTTNRMADSINSAARNFFTLQRYPNVDAAVQGTWGMAPGQDRLNLLPRYSKADGWVAPEILYQLARAVATPYVAAGGGQVTPEDAFNVATNAVGTGLGVSGMMRNPAPGPGKTLPMTVYHGSPHSFDAFDMSKIGTGEGAQAYGHGLYVAESPDVAGSYATRLTHQAGEEATIGGKKLSELYSHFYDRANRAPRGQADALYERAGVLEDLMLHKTPQEVLKNAAENGYSQSTLNWLSNEVIPNYKRLGNLYHVDLPDSAIANMLDWDKPLSQQPENVQRALADVRKLDPAPNLSPSDPEGSYFYSILTGEYGQIKASEKLKALGIPGIKYLDGGSRAAGDGTRNYVVFDDKLLKILKKE